MSIRSARRYRNLQAAMGWNPEKECHGQLSVIRRILHSVGDSGMTGLMDVYSLCHQAESAFEEIADMSSRADLVLRVKDWIETVMELVRRGGNGKPESADGAQPHKIKTLVIDDDQVCRQRVSMIVKEFCECTFANDGKQGFELFEKAFEEGQPFQFVTLDIQMPELDGHRLSAIQLFEQHGVEGLDSSKSSQILPASFQPIFPRSRIAGL
jgi:chemotaxis protein histidine kinase CheA